MTWRSWMAALAVVALTCAVLGSTGPRASEQLKLAAGPGEGPGASDTAPGEGPEAGPATGSGEGAAAPDEAPPSGAPSASPAEETAAPEEAKPGAGEESDEAPEPVSAEAAAAAEKVKAGDIPVPSDPGALTVFKVIERNCSRCHQAGPTLKRLKPAKNFGNILHLDEIASDPNLILPGNPDGSKLFIMVAKKEMPYDCYQEFDCKAEPTVQDVQAIYDWIKSLGQIAVAACAGRHVIDEEAIVTAIAADLEQQQEHRRKGMRYITLSHFYDACAPETDMVRYRQGVVKLLNSLSRESDVLKLRVIDPDKTIVAFNLDDLGWTEADWNQIIGIYPYAMKPDATVYKTVAVETNTPLAWVRGDWFAFTASRSPLYYGLLKLPDSFAELQLQLVVDVQSDIEKILAKRAGFQNSGVSKHNRLIERHGLRTGYFWTSYDFKGDRPEQSLFIHPLGPYGTDAFQHDGGETIFSLPNGFQAYFLNTAKGDRLDKGPTEIVLDDSQPDRAVTNAISCMGCHNQGIRQASDEIRQHVLSDPTVSEEMRAQVEALYVSPEEFKDLLDQDAKRFRDALLRADLDPELDSAAVGVESINYLAKQYEKSIDLRLAAAEYGLPREAFAQGLADAGGEAAQLKRRLEQGVLPRQILEAEFKDLIVKVSDNAPIEIASSPIPDVARVGGESREELHDFDLALTSDRSIYKVNDLPLFTIKSSKDCHLTLIDVDASGEGTVIFPNKFQQDNFLPSGKEAQFPGADAPFQFRLKDPGTETVIAICNATGKVADGIKHDFKTRGFTDLGNYREFLTRQIVVEGAEKVAEGQKEKGKEVKPSAAPAPAGVPSDILSRTAIKLLVK